MYDGKTKDSGAVKKVQITSSSRTKRAPAHVVFRAGQLVRASFSTDGYVDSYDILSWDWAMSGEDRLLNFCEVPLISSSTTATGIAASDLEGAGEQLSLRDMASNLRDLLIAGKRDGNNAAGKLQDRLYIFDRDGLCEGWFTPASNRCNIRLVQGPEGELYQINSETGVLRLDETNEAIIPPCRIELTVTNEPRYNKSANIYVGIQGCWRLPPTAMRKNIYVDDDASLCYKLLFL